LDPHFLSLEEALIIHADAVALYGGSPGVRDSGLLESALSAPRNLFAYGQANPEILEGAALLAAAYWFHITMNHPFIDGNKRASLMCAIAFLNLNGWDLDMSYELGLDLSIKLASHSVDRDQLGRLLALHVVSN